MNDTQQAPPSGGPDEGFDPHRLRSITDMRRSRNDRLLGGVCSGAAQYLRIDPVIVRVVIAVLTIVGFAGVILYAAAWFLIPSEDAEKSVAADWFKLDKNEEQVRVVGLIAAGVLAAIAVVGDNGYAWWGVPWFLVPLAVLYYFFVVRPRRGRAEATNPDAAAPAGAAVPTTVVADSAETHVIATDPPRPGLVHPRPPRERRSGALSVLTVSVIAIAVATTRIWAEYHDGPGWTTYVAIALGITALGLLVGTFFGHGGPLIALGIVLAVALALGSVMPSPRIGAQNRSPMTAAQVDDEYRHGVGLLKLDLTDVSDPDQLLGSTVKLRSAVGQIKVVVPQGLNVEVTSQLDAGEIAVFERKVNGTQNELDFPATAGAPALTLDIDETLGNIEVIRK